MRFWWLSDCNCIAPLRARACCGVRTERARPGLATSIGAELRRSEAKKSESEVAEQCERTRESHSEAIARGSLYATFDATESKRATDTKG